MTVKPRRPKTSRCPACNPLHSAKHMKTLAKREKMKKDCVVCKGTGMVPTARAAAFTQTFYAHHGDEASDEAPED